MSLYPGAPGANQYPSAQYQAAVGHSPVSSSYAPPLPGAGGPPPLSYGAPPVASQYPTAASAYTAASQYPSSNYSTASSTLAPTPVIGGGASPLAQNQYLSSPQIPQTASAQTIQPGSITYNTTTDTAGRTLYHVFRAEPSSYTNSQGVTYTGIQWVPVETSYVPPTGATPAGADFSTSWSRGAQVPPGAAGAPGLYASDRDRERERERTYKDWERDEQRRRRKEDKETAKRLQGWDSEKRARERAEEKELKKARERDVFRERELERQRERRLSNAAAFPPSTYPGAPQSTTVPSSTLADYGSPYERERDRDMDRRSIYGGSGGTAELERAMGDLNVGSRLSAYGGGGGVAGVGSGGPQLPRSRRNSMSVPATSSGPYDDPYADRDRYDDYDRPPITPIRTAPEKSPYRRGASPLPPVLGPGGVPVYPSGHVYEGQPIAGPGGALSRSHSPVPGTAPYPQALSRGPSPRIGGNAQLAYSGPPGQDLLLSTPEAFSRPINRAMPFTPFEMMKIRDLEYFDKDLPRFPIVLTTHDVFTEDWQRLMNDIALAWAGRLPLPNFSKDHTPKRSSVVIDLLDLWNAAFFLPRGVELVLYKGRDRRSGRGAGRPETRLPRIEESDSELSTTSTEEDALSEADGGSKFRGYGVYGGMAQQDRWANDIREARQYRIERQEEKKRRARERKLRRRDKSKAYTLYMTYVPPRDYNLT